jgi:3-oxoacyl-[acyl-carrier protein] reductase
MASVLITGGTRGIGLALGRAFLKQGWKLTTCYHQDEDSAEAARREYSLSSPDFQLLKCDVSREKPVEELIQAAVQQWGSLDCAVHNAGATWNARIPNVEEAQWEDTLGVHLKGAFLVSKACLKPMIKQKSGHLLFISSIVASTGNIGQASYTAAKGGVLGLMRSVAREYGGRNIRCNAVFPGFHKTRLADGLSPEVEEAIRKNHLLGSTADLNEVAEFVVWLAGTRTISGQVFNLDSRMPGWI